MTLLLSAVAVPVNTVFGVTSAILIARNEFPGKLVVMSMLDLPFSISPVVTGQFPSLLFLSPMTFLSPRTFLSPLPPSCFPPCWIALVLPLFPFVDFFPCCLCQAASKVDAVSASHHSSAFVCQSCKRLRCTFKCDWQDLCVVYKALLCTLPLATSHEILIGNAWGQGAREQGRGGGLISRVVYRVHRRGGKGKAKLVHRLWQQQ